MKKKVIIATISVLAISLLGGMTYYFSHNSRPVYDFAAVKNSDVKLDVTVDGTTKAAEEINLAFEKSGKLSKVYVKVGDQVKSGQTLAQLAATDVAAQLNQVQAAYLAQVAVLEGLKSGAGPADLNVTATKIDSANKTIADAVVNLENTKNKAQTDLDNLYARAKDILNDASLKSNDAIVNNANNFFDNILSGSPRYKYYTYYTTKQSAVEQKFTSVYPMNAEIKTIANGLGNDQSVIDEALANVESKLSAELVFLRDLVDLLEQTNNIDANKAAFKASVSLSATYINAAISAINTEQQALSTQKAANKSLITAAEAQLNQANNSLQVAQSELQLKKSGATESQIKAQESVVAQALANVQNYQAQLAKLTITSPIDGVVSRQDGDEGEIVTMNVPVISVLSNAKYQIETQIPEAEIGKIKAGQQAFVTLDAFGSSKEFTAKVIATDLTSTIVASAPTYKTTLEFTSDDPEIKSGLSANVKITIDERKNVLTVPQSSIFTDSGNNFVIVDNGTKTGEKRQVVLGVAGDSGQTEILSGLSSNDRVAQFGYNN